MVKPDLSPDLVHISVECWSLALPGQPTPNLVHCRESCGLIGEILKFPYQSSTLPCIPHMLGDEYRALIDRVCF